MLALQLAPQTGWLHYNNETPQITHPLVDKCPNMVHLKLSHSDMKTAHKFKVPSGREPQEGKAGPTPSWTKGE